MSRVVEIFAVVTLGLSIASLAALALFLGVVAYHAATGQLSTDECGAIVLSSKGGDE